MSKRTMISWVVFVVFCAVWWFYIVDWLIKPATYRISIAYMAAVVITSAFHLRALVRFIRMVRAVKLEESLGEAEPGSTMFAANQRFRYAVRVFESTLVFCVAVIALIAVHHPQVALNRNYGRLVITYFIGSVLATGWLTVRDLRLIDWVRKQDADAHDAARVSSARKRPTSQS